MGQTMDRKTKALIDGLPPALRNLMLTRTVEEGDCLIWTGMTCVAFTRVPRCHYDYLGAHTKASRSLRRTISEAMEGKPLGKRVASCMCGTPLCVHPAHLSVMTRKAAMQRASAAGKIKGAATTARNRVSGLRRRKLTDDQIREILARSEESQSRLALEFGVSRATIGSILHRKRRASDDIWSAVFWRLAA
jgi:hypothetical protein